MGRLLAVLALAAFLVTAAPASAATRMYVSTARAADGTVSASGYAFDGATQVLDDFQLDLRRGGVTVATDHAVGFVTLAPPALQAGDELVLTDTATAESHTATFTGQPTLVAPGCGAAAFSGTREEGSTVDVSAALGAESVPTVQRFGAGTTYAGTFAKALSTGWIVKASQARAIDPAFTVFDAVSATVGGTCPVVTVPAPPVVEAPAVEPPAPVEAAPLPPVAVADVVAPVGRATVRTKAAAAYRALVAGSFAVAVTVNEPATVTERVRAGRVTVARASKRAAAAGTVVVKLKLTAAGRRRLAVRSRSVKLTVATTVRDTAGNTRALASRVVTVARPAR